MIITKKEYLEHHGIKGQKWGVRRGPPYPLDSNSDRAIRSRTYKSNNKKRKASELKTTGWYSEVFDWDTFNPKSLFDLQLRRDDESVEHLVYDMNSTMRKEIEIGNGDPMMSNCMNCATALELQFRGYDVRPRPSESGRKYKEMNDIFKGLDVDNYGRSINYGRSPETKEDAYSNFIDTINLIDRDYPSNQRGMVHVGFKNGGAHIFNWFRDENNKVSLADSQTGGVWRSNPTEYPSMFNQISDCRFFSTDNLEITDSAASWVWNDDDVDVYEYFREFGEN